MPPSSARGCWLPRWTADRTRPSLQEVPWTMRGPVLSPDLLGAVVGGDPMAGKTGRGTLSLAPVWVSLFPSQEREEGLREGRDLPQATQLVRGPTPRGGYPFCPHVRSASRSSACGGSDRGRFHTHRPLCHLRVTQFTSLSLTPFICGVGAHTLPHDRCSLTARCPPASREQEERARGRTGLSARPAVRAEAAPHPAGWQGAPAGPVGGRLSRIPLFPGGPGREMVLPRPQRLAGPARASVPGNILAQNYIRLKVSIFCAILLPDLIVHLWQCLYTSPVQDNSVAAATGARQRCNLEISGSGACLFQGGTPSLSPGRAPCPLPHRPSGFFSLLPSKELPGSPSPRWKSKSHLVT